MLEGAKVRDYEPKDFEDIKRIHQQGGLDYKFPNIETPIFLVKKVMTVDDKVVGAALWRFSVETYLLLDKESGLTPQQNMEVLIELQAEGLHQLWTLGIEDCIAWVPEVVDKHFAKRLVQLGWSRNRENWFSWSRNTEPKS